MRKPIDPNRKITQVADPEFYRFSDPFLKPPRAYACVHMCKHAASPILNLGGLKHHTAYLSTVSK